MMKPQHICYALIFIGILVPQFVKADIWELPKIEIYYSKNGKYKLIITPKVVSGKYALWEYYTNNSYPKTRKILRKKEKFMKTISAQDTILIPCIAELYRIGSVDTALMWKKALLNNICPTHAIVANDGSSIATFDNWYSSGYGVNVFVIYNEKGEAKRSYKLEEISPFPLNDYNMSISSLWWREEVNFIDNSRIKIIFYTSENDRVEKIYNLKNYDFE